ncbi:RGS domain-containing protein [Plasmodiophora brassicae]|uniref:RGS domain-containing protein n=1 Tax=Plasmodiophora brassicae TaxID=37360 RepID=A0A0G4IYR9_PLABS|nr:hypothetical protein PBRA_007895 [Plasmodiophora brassicae]SPQ98967.1 unnamed protein product [Plasmodiophora brassicae]
MVSHDDQVELVGFLAYDCTVLLAMFVAFVRHWDRTPIRERHPTIVIVIEVLVALIPYSDWVASQYPESILASLIAAVVFNLTPLHGTLVRTAFLYCNYRRTRAKVLLSATTFAHTGAVAQQHTVLRIASSVQPHPEQGQASRTDMLFATRPYLVKEAFWFKVLLGLMAIDVVVMAVAYAECQGMPALPGAFTQFNNSVILLHLIMVFVIILQLGNCHDAFHIKLEITAVSVIGIVGTIVANYCVPPIDGQHTPMKRLSTWIVTKVTTSVSLLMPVYWARRANARVGPQYGRMDQLLEVDMIRLAFTEYLQKEFAVESMLFHEARRQFIRKWSKVQHDRPLLSAMSTTTTTTTATGERSDSSIVALMEPEWTDPLRIVADEVVVDAHTIYTTFIRIGAPFEINISSALRRAYVNLFEPGAQVDTRPAPSIDIDSRVFDRAWTELRALLEYAAFHRFLETDIAADILKMG